MYVHNQEYPDLFLVSCNRAEYSDKTNSNYSDSAVYNWWTGLVDWTTGLTGLYWKHQVWEREK